MNNRILINIKDENEWIKKHFDNKDLVTIEEIFGVIEDLDFEVDKLNEQLEDFKQNVADNYKPISPYEQFDVNENDFH